MALTCLHSKKKGGSRSRRRSREPEWLELKPRRQLNLTWCEREIAGVGCCCRPKERNRRVCRGCVEGEGVPRCRPAQGITQGVHAGHVLMVEDIEGFTIEFQFHVFGDWKPLGNPQVHDVGLRLAERVPRNSGDAKRPV